MKQGATMNQKTNSSSHGFTIVELLIVIVVIGILAAITIVAYNGIQDRGRMSRMQNDLRNIKTAVLLARTQQNQVLGAVTGNWATAGSCMGKPAGTDLAALPPTDNCWVDYKNTLDKISIASSQNIRGLVDPWGRPYLIDENENEGGPANCTKDSLGAFQLPYVSSWTPMANTGILVQNSATGC
jgi:prepilin-type N-terminal cleavage/methylation domain-containing protein